MMEYIPNGHQNGTSGEYEEIKVPVPWGHITGKWWGSRAVQPIIAIHGWQDNSGTFDNLAPLLVAKGFSIYCIDLPGHGFSSHIPKGLQYYLWYDGVHFLRRVVKYFNWKNITIIGHSLGGGIAFLYASIYPDEISKYVSLDISSPSVRSSQKMIAIAGSSLDKMFDYEKKSADQMPCYDYENMLALMVQAHTGSVDREGCRILLRRGMTKAPHKEGCYLFTRDPRLKVGVLGFMTMDLVLNFASQIKCEVLNIRASQGLKVDPLENYDIPLEYIEKYAKKLVRVNVEGTHHVHLTNAEVVEPAITEFLLSK
ncbi:probable serine hydrolase [Diabrotica undecimpunctata]|uniref:probable serine hydrolase n=1 Tax=Diabrotica undecimpunctata TaxID=50387 RepID=UPI003B64069E